MHIHVFVYVYANLEGNIGGFCRDFQVGIQECNKVWIFIVVECLYAYVFMKILKLIKVGFEGNFKWVFKKCNKVWIFTTKERFRE